MNWKHLIILLLSEIFISRIAGQPVLKLEENQTLTWEETIAYYQFLDDSYPEARYILIDTHPFQPIITASSGTFMSGRNIQKKH